MPPATTLAPGQALSHLHVNLITNNKQTTGESRRTIATHKTINKQTTPQTNLNYSDTETDLLDIPTFVTCNNEKTPTNESVQTKKVVPPTLLLQIAVKTQANSTVTDIQTDKCFENSDYCATRHGAKIRIYQISLLNLLNLAYTKDSQLLLATQTCRRSRQGQHYRQDVACLEQDYYFALLWVWFKSYGIYLVEGQTKLPLQKSKKS